MSRHRFRFSVRTLLVWVMLVGVYFGSWQTLEERALYDVGEYTVYSGRPVDATNLSSLVPFIVGVDEARVFMTVTPQYWRHYYFWFFGAIVQLPGKYPIAQPTDHAPWPTAATD